MKELTKLCETKCTTCEKRMLKLVGKFQKIYLSYLEFISKSNYHQSEAVAEAGIHICHHLFHVPSQRFFPLYSQGHNSHRLQQLQGQSKDTECHPENEKKKVQITHCNPKFNITLTLHYCKMQPSI